MHNSIWKLLVGVALVLAALTLQRPACADEYVVATLRSYHFDRKRPYNENNFGLGLETRHSAYWSSAYGYYHNSYYRTSVYATLAYQPMTIAGWRIGTSFGAVSGYSSHIDPWLVAVASKDFGRFGLNVVAAPAGLALQAKWRFE